MYEALSTVAGSQKVNASNKFLESDLGRELTLINFLSLSVKA